MSLDICFLTHDVRLGLRDHQVALCGATVPHVVVQLVLLGLWQWFSFKRPTQTRRSNLLQHFAGRGCCWFRPGSGVHVTSFHVIGFDPAKPVAVAAPIRVQLVVVDNLGGVAVALCHLMRGDILIGLTKCLHKFWTSSRVCWMTTVVDMPELGIPPRVRCFVCALLIVWQFGQCWANRFS